MKVVNCRINGIENPLGYLLETISISWNVEETESRKAADTVIEVAADELFSSVIFVKEGAELKSSGTLLEMNPSPRTRYYFRVRVTGDRGDSAVSRTGFFETGKMEEPWAAEWITAPGSIYGHPIFRKTFSAPEDVRSARLCICGLGLFEAYLDGEKIGEEFLTPYTGDYEQVLQSITFDLDGKLAKRSEDGKLQTGSADGKPAAGSHELSVLMGRGWYSGLFGLEGKEENYGSGAALIAELHLTSADGTDTVIATDGSWTFTESDIEESGIYDGEAISRLLFAGKENHEKKTAVIENPGTGNFRCLDKSHLTDRLSLPVLVMEKMPVKEVLQTPDGETVLDMGQNFAGFIEYKSAMPCGGKLTLNFGEILQGGNFYNGNYREARSEFTYVSDGRQETIRPHFTFFGFRYVRVRGLAEVKKEDFTGCVLYSDLARTGFISTGNQKIDRLFENTLWGLKSNFIDMPTDCPQRNERLGWTGDAQVFAAAASYHMDTRAFYHKFIRDLHLEQTVLDGAVPNYLPNLGHKRDAGSVWGDIAAILPDTLYHFYGNEAEAACDYPMLSSWVDWIDRKDGERGHTWLFDFAFSFGDWLALDGPTENSFKGATDDVYISTTYYFHSVQIAERMAHLLGKRKEAARYHMLAENILKALRNEFFTPGGRGAIDTQAACIIALKFGTCPDRGRMIAQLKERIEKDCGKITCGFVGAPLLCTTLAEAGLTDLAYDFLFNEEYPGWLCCVNQGATTVWERWNSVLPDGTINPAGMNSLNHYAYGSVAEFLYAYAAGIRPLEPGFRKAYLAPVPDIRLGSLACTYKSAAGRYESRWEILENGRIRIHFTVPFGAEAEAHLPDCPDGSVQNLAAGSYDFEYQPMKDYRRPYGWQSTLKRLSGDPQAMAVLGQMIPPVYGMASSDNPEMRSHTLEELSQMDYLHLPEKELREAVGRLEEIIAAPARKA